MPSQIALTGETGAILQSIKVQLDETLSNRAWHLLRSWVSSRHGCHVKTHKNKPGTLVHWYWPPHQILLLLIACCFLVNLDSPHLQKLQLVFGHKGDFCDHSTSVHVRAGWFVAAPCFCEAVTHRHTHLYTTEPPHTERTRLVKHPATG